MIPTLFFPVPSQILRSTFEMTASGTLTRHLALTLARMCLALALGGIPGLLLGLAMGWLPYLRAVLDPFVAALHPIPKIALLPLVMVILGVGDASLVVVIALGAFFPMLINTMTGVWQINPIHFEVARNYGASKGQVFRRVVWPGSLPLVLAGLRLALNATLLLTVAAEMFTPQNGLGAMIWFGWQTMLTAEIYVSLLVITVLGILFSYSIDLIGRRWVPWEPSRIT
jgi:NitT/TauT family transport system permease protein